MLTVARGEGEVNRCIAAIRKFREKHNLITSVKEIQGEIRDRLWRQKRKENLKNDHPLPNTRIEWQRMLSPLQKTLDNSNLLVEEA